MKVTAEVRRLWAEGNRLLAEQGAGPIVAYDNDTGRARDGATPDEILSGAGSLVFYSAVCLVCGNSDYTNDLGYLVAGLASRQSDHTRFKSRVEDAIRFTHYPEWCRQVASLCPRCRALECTVCGRKLNTKVCQPRRLEGFRRTPPQCEVCQVESLVSLPPPKLAMASRRILSKLARGAYEIPKA